MDREDLTLGRCPPLQDLHTSPRRRAEAASRPFLPYNYVVLSHPWALARALASTCVVTAQIAKQIANAMKTDLRMQDERVDMLIEQEDR